MARAISGNKNRGKKNVADHYCYLCLSVRRTRLNALRVGAAVFKIMTEPILQLTIATLNYRCFFLCKIYFCTNCKYVCIVLL